MHGVPITTSYHSNAFKLSRIVHLSPSQYHLVLDKKNLQTSLKQLNAANSSHNIRRANQKTKSIRELLSIGYQRDVRIRFLTRLKSQRHDDELANRRLEQETAIAEFEEPSALSFSDPGSSTQPSDAIRTPTANYRVNRTN